MRSYSDIFAYGHKALEELWNGTVYVQEKIDGSQFSFGLNPDTGEVEFRSRRVMIDRSDPGMFKVGIDAILERAGYLLPGWTYRGEFLAKPKHNALAYGRVPRGHVILFDIDMGDQDYISPGQLASTAGTLLLEAVPMLLSTGTWDHTPMPLEQLRELLNTDSILGGTKVEGIVLKNYDAFARDKKVLMGKLVRADFQEVNKKNWKAENPSPNDFMLELAQRYSTEARWQKAVQHLREAGVLQEAPQDIPTLLKEVNEDVLKECKDEISAALFAHFWKKYGSRLITRGLPEWWKGRLARSAEEMFR